MPTLLFGNENWNLNRRQEHRSLTMQMKFIRRVMRTRRVCKTRITILMKIAAVPSILDEIRKNKLGWFGHVVRMDEEKPTKYSYKTRAEGRNRILRKKSTFTKTRRNRRSWPRKRWKDGMVKILRGRGIE